MKYHIDTIPVWDAFKKDCECPLCELQAQNEQAYLENFLGASVMEPDVRIEVNAKGFCGRHFEMMFVMKNRLGLALMTHTHLQQVIEGIQAPAPKKGGLLKKKEETPPPDDAARCVLCERLSGTMDRYLYTVLHLWKTDPEFKQTLEASKGFCLPHYRRLTAMAERELSGERGQAFQAMLTALQKENMARIEKELFWFTQKFDYRNTDKPWGNSKDAVERAINKLRGKTVEGQ